MEKELFPKGQWPDRCLCFLFLCFMFHASNTSHTNFSIRRYNCLTFAIIYSSNISILFSTGCFTFHQRFPFFRSDTFYKVRKAYMLIPIFNIHVLCLSPKNVSSLPPLDHISVYPNYFTCFIICFLMF